MTPQQTEAHTDIPLDAPRRSWFMPAVASVTVLMMLAGAVALLTSRPNGRNDSSVGQPAPNPTGPSPAAIRAVPQETLAKIAATLLASPPTEAQGRYIYISRETWATQGDGILPQRDESWYEPVTRRRYDATRQLPTVAMDVFRPGMIGHTDFSTAEFSDSQFTLPPSSVRPPLSDNPTELMRQANDDGQTTGLSASGAVDFIAGIYSDTYPSVRVRAAAFNALATIDGLIIDDQATDPIGRRGVSITGTNTDGVRVTLIINPADGMALASSFEHPDRSPMAPHLWVVYLISTRTDMLNLPTA